MGLTDIKQLLPADIYDALIGANSPSAANPYATIADLTGGGNTIYTGDDALTGNRVVDLATFSLQFDTTGGTRVWIGGGSPYGMSGSTLETTLLGTSEVDFGTGPTVWMTMTASASFGTIQTIGNKLALIGDTGTVFKYAGGVSTAGSIDASGVWYINTASQVGFSKLNVTGDVAFNNDLYMMSKIRLAQSGFTFLQGDGAEVWAGVSSGFRIDKFDLSVTYYALSVSATIGNVHSFEGNVLLVKKAGSTDTSEGVAVGSGISFPLPSRLTINGDAETLGSTKGYIVLDRTNATRYRIYTDGGILFTEAA